MQKYYYNDGVSRLGPFTIEELQAKNITAETPIWYDGLANWTKAGELEELKSILTQAPAAATVIAAEVKVEEASDPIKNEASPAVAAEAATAAASAAVAETQTAPSPVKEMKAVKPGKKSTAWVSWVFGLIVLGGTGYFVYQDMEKNKGGGSERPGLSSASDSTALHQYVEQTSQNNATETNPANPATPDTTAATADVNAVAPTQDNTKLAPPPPAAVAPSKNNPKQPANTKPTATTAKAQQAEAQKAAQQKAEEQKKQQAAAQAALAKEKDYRNNWAKYISVGKLDYKMKEDDGGIDPFNVPVANNTGAMLDKVTIRIDYWKKDKKVVQSETITVYNIPSGTILNGKAAGYKKGNNAKAVITGITARKIHFCYPGNSYAPDDPFYCN